MRDRCVCLNWFLFFIWYFVFNFSTFSKYVGLHDTQRENWVNNLQRSWYLFLVECFMHTPHTSFAHILLPFSLSLSFSLTPNPTVPPCFGCASKAFNSIIFYLFIISTRRVSRWMKERDAMCLSMRWEQLNKHVVRSVFSVSFRERTHFITIKQNTLNVIKSKKQDQRQHVSPGWLMSASIKRMARF